MEQTKTRDKINPNFGRFEMLKVSELHSDGTYQRPVSAWRVRDIVFNYKPILFQPLIIGLRKGRWYVVDGQHRREAAEQLNFDEVPCMVYDTISAAEEAKAFLWLQQYRRAITAPQKFAARIAFGDPPAVAIADALQRHGFETGSFDKFDNAHKNNRITSISSLERAYDVGGEKMVDHILYVLRNAWDGRAAALDKRILRGLTRFMAENAYGHKALAEKLGALAPYDLISAALSVSHQRGLNENDAMGLVIFNVYREAGLKARVPK